MTLLNISGNKAVPRGATPAWLMMCVKKTRTHCFLCKPEHQPHVHVDTHHRVAMSYFPALMRLNGPEKHQSYHIYYLEPQTVTWLLLLSAQTICCIAGIDWLTSNASVYCTWGFSLIQRSNPSFKSLSTQIQGSTIKIAQLEIARSEPFCFFFISVESFTWAVLTGTRD